MSELLREFLQAWIDWVDTGAPEGKPFSRSEGLCLSVYAWPASEHAIRGRVGDILENELHRDGLSCLYPFGGCVQYMAERRNETQHLNPDRLAWVRSKVAQHEAV